MTCFGGLRGDASKRLGRLRLADFAPDFCLGVNALGGGKDDLMHRILNDIDHAFYGIDLNVAGGLVQVGNQILLSAKLLACSGEHGIFDRVEYDLRDRCPFPCSEFRWTDK